jgi:hypothetical protein
MEDKRPSVEFPAPDIERVAGALSEARKAPDVSGLPDREQVLRSIQAIARESAPATAAPAVSTNDPADQKPSGTTVTPGYLDDSEAGMNAKTEVESLVRMTLRQGLGKGLAAARGRSPFIEDAYHDALVDCLLPELKKRGMIS